MLLLQTTQAAPSGWDNLRDWISALGSLGAALLAAVAFFWGVRGRRQRAWAELSSQARRIVAFPDTIPLDPTPLVSTTRSTLVVGPSELTAVTVRNTSEEPVYDCRIEVWVRNVVRASGGDDVFSLLLPIAPPGSTTLKLPGAPVDDWRLAKIHMFFVDSANVTWLRDENGRLSQADLVDKPPGRLSQWLHRKPEPLEEEVRGTRSRRRRYGLGRIARRALRRWVH